MADGAGRPPAAAPVSPGEALAPRQWSERCLAIPRNQKVRAVAFQALLVLGLMVVLAWLAANAIDNLRRANIVSGFAFLKDRAGFEIAQSLIAYSADSSYARALLVGLLNTLLVACLGIAFSTLLGVAIALARLSGNWLIGSFAVVYIEVIRNIPVLLQLVFWYRGILLLLPGPRPGYALPFAANLNNRGLVLPRPVLGAGSKATLAAFLAAVVIVVAMTLWARRRRWTTGRPFPLVTAGAVVLLGVPLAVFLASGAPLRFEAPVLTGFSFVGGWNIRPELLVLVLGLSLYTASFIAEVVRAGIVAVGREQRDAGRALGLRRGQA